MRVKNVRVKNVRVKNVRVKLVGVTGFEPAAPRSQSECATKLRYTPVPEPQPAGMAHAPIGKCTGVRISRLHTLGCQGTSRSVRSSRTGELRGMRV